jgi:hypothetical protein
MCAVHILDIREAKFAKEIAFEMWRWHRRFALLRLDLVTATSS